MTTNDDKAILVLNDLLLAARDAEKGFQLATNHVRDRDLVEFFAALVLQRAKFQKDLDHRIRTLRAVPAQPANPAAALHRAWMGLVTALESNETHAVLTECERGEDVSVTAYREALAERDLDLQTRGLIQSQYELVQAAHDRLRQLRDSATYAHR
jgi:uncharacterized protein (TIGR02284 family)